MDDINALDRYTAYSPTWSGIGTQVALSASISLICLVIHEIFRNRSDFRHLFSARCYLIKNSSPQPSKTLFGWIRSVWKIEETFILHNVGLDAVLYLRALKMIFQLMMMMVIVVMPILLPVNYLSQQYESPSKGKVDELSITGVYTSPSLLWIHTFLNAGVSLMALYLIYRNTVDFVELRRIHFLKEAMDGNPRCRTVMVTNIPDSLCDEDRLRDHFDNLSLGHVYCVQLLRYPTKLIEYINRRKKALIELEKAHIELAKNVISAVNSGKLSQQDFDRSDNSWEYLQLKLYLKDPVQYSSSLVNHNLREKLMVQSSIESGTITVWDVLLRLDYGLLAPYHPHHRTSYKTGRRCQSIDYWYNKMVILDRRIANLRAGQGGGGKLGGNINSQVAPTGFVTFENPASAQLCAQSIIHPSINTCQTYLAPEPKDILWKNHTLAKSSRISRKLAVNILSWVMIILWLVPITAVLYLVSLESLAKLDKNLLAFTSQYIWAQSLLQTFIPATLLAIFMSILPHLLYAISSIEAWKTFSSFERAVTIRYYYFCLFNVVFVFLLGPSVVKILFDAVQNRLTIVETFADRIPKGAAFFINYVIFNLSYQFMELLVLAAPFLLSLVSWVFQKSPRERKILEHSWPFPFYYYLPNHMLIFIIVLTYSTVNPFIIPIGALYFFLAFIVFKNQFVYCYIKRYESNGRIWNLFVRFMTDGLIISQLTTACIVAFNTQFYSIIPLAFTLIATFYFKYYYRKTFRQRLKYVPLDSLKEMEDSPRASVHRNSMSSPRTSVDITPKPTPPTFHRASHTPDIQPTPNFRSLSFPFRRHTPDIVITEVGNSSSISTENMALSQDRSFSQSRVEISEAGGEDIEEQPNWVYYAQAFSHPALTKSIPIEMNLPMYPNHRYYDLYKDVASVDLIVSTSTAQPPRDLAHPVPTSSNIHLMDPKCNKVLSDCEFDLDSDPISSRFTFSDSELCLTNYGTPLSTPNLNP